VTLPSDCGVVMPPSAGSEKTQFPESMVVNNYRVEALAVADGKIVAAGTNDLINSYRGDKTQVIDLGGLFAMPGFNDAHTHLAAAGSEKLNVDLVGAKSLEEMQQRIARRAHSAGAGEWILGEGWDHTLWAAQKLPTRQDLDSVTAGHPAIF